MGRGQRWEDADLRAWERFRRRLAALSTMAEARELYADSPPPDSPGRRYYSNLGFFLESFTVPSGSSYEERELHLRFVEKLDDAGRLKPGSGQEIRDDLRTPRR